MPKKKRFLLAVPPKSKRVRYFRIRFAIIVVLIIVLLGGGAGFFLPLNTLTLDVVEVNQQKNLTDQNKNLLSKIKNMRESIFTLKRKVDTLTEVKANVEEVVGLDQKAAITRGSRKNRFEKMKIDDLLKYVNSTASLYQEFLEKVNKNPEYFNYLPIIKPVSDECVITARFGKRRDPFTGDIKWHNGIDFSGDRESPVIATASGRVSMVQEHQYWGRRVRIRHRFGFSTLYAHLGTVKVHKGKNVKKGDVIATIGISGLTTGPHLHYEVHFKDSIVDPSLYFFPDTIPSVAYSVQ